MRYFLFTLILFFYHDLVFGQTDSVKYTKDFVFKDGIYIKFQDFKNNNPPLTPENFKKYNPDEAYLEKNFYNRANCKYINYPKNDSVLKIVIDSIWGFAKNNEIFKVENISNSEVERIWKIGKICLAYMLKASKGSINSIYYYGLVPTALGIAPTVPTAVKDNHYLISFDSGNWYKFNLKNCLKLLEKKDKELFDEFSKLPNSKQKDMMFIYLNKLNERNPIYFKTNN